MCIRDRVSIAPLIGEAIRRIANAAAYEDYMARAALVDPNFKSGADVAQALKLGASDDPQALLRGEIAYAAIAALQDPNYCLLYTSSSMAPSASCSNRCATPI